MRKVQSAIDIVSAQRARLGALQNRLEHTIANLDTASENTQAAESRLRDTDMAEEMEYVPLHLHTEYSLLDGAIRIGELCKFCVEHNMPGVAVTDHGSCASWVEFSNYFNKKGNIKPIFGLEAYCSSEDIKMVNKRRRDHLILLALNDEGLVNIRRIQRLSEADHYYKPIVKYDTTLETFNTNGIFATSACSLSTISNCLLNNDFNGACRYAEYFYDMFDGNFALELQPHFEYRDQAIINNGIVKLSDKLDYPIIVTCDSHFCNEEDRDLRKIIQAIGMHKQIDDNSLYDSLKSNCIGNTGLIYTFFDLCNFEYDNDIIDMAIRNTSVIADMCNAQLEKPERRIPVFNKHKEFVEVFNGVDWS